MTTVLLCALVFFVGLAFGGTLAMGKSKDIEALARELSNQLRLTAHFIDAVEPWAMPVGWNQVVAQADAAIKQAEELLP